MNKKETKNYNKEKHQGKNKEKKTYKQVLANNTKKHDKKIQPDQKITLK